MLEKKAGLAVPAWFDDQAYNEAEYVFYSVGRIPWRHFGK